ncbi:MAG: hypothetical protein MJK12_15125 [Colwellia sp.]|nr:hypothetical protein [Colwellia sp.]
MERLRDVYGVSKLGPRVIKKIELQLKAARLKSVDPLTLDRSDKVRLYILDGREEELVNAFKNPGSEFDDILSRASNNRIDYLNAIERIAEIVDETLE